MQKIAILLETWSRIWTKEENCRSLINQEDVSEGPSRSNTVQQSSPNSQSVCLRCYGAKAASGNRGAYTC